MNHAAVCTSNVHGDAAAHSKHSHFDTIHILEDQCCLKTECMLQSDDQLPLIGTSHVEAAVAAEIDLKFVLPSIYSPGRHVPRAIQVITQDASAIASCACQGVRAIGLCSHMSSRVHGHAHRCPGTGNGYG